MPSITQLAQFTRALRGLFGLASKLSATRTGAYLGDHRYLTTTIYGHKMFLDTRDMTLVPHIILDGVWEAWVTDRVLSCLRPGMRVVEVGSNLGWYTLLMAQEIGPEGRLIAFEANADLIRYTFDSVCINGYLERVMLHNLAVSDTMGEATFYVRDRHLGNSSLAQIPESFLDSIHDGHREIRVGTVALDEFLVEGDRKIDLLRIDAEGSEPLILHGMKDLLQENQQITIVMEYSPYQMQTVGFDPQETMAFLFQMGFQAFRIEPLKGLTPMTWETLQPLSHCDLVLSRNPSFGR